MRLVIPGPRTIAAAIRNVFEDRGNRSLGLVLRQQKAGGQFPSIPHRDPNNLDVLNQIAAFDDVHGLAGHVASR